MSKVPFEIMMRCFPDGPPAEYKKPKKWRKKLKKAIKRYLKTHDNSNEREVRALYYGGNN